MNGPDPEVLKQLHADMPGMVQDLENQKQLKGQKSARLARPSKLCTCCGKGFEYKMVQLKELPEVEPCKACEGLLKHGYICFVSDNRYAFIRSDLPDVVAWAGKIVHIPVDYMDRLQLKFTAAKVLKRDADPKNN